MKIEGRKEETARVTEIMAVNLLSCFEERSLKDLPNDPALVDDLRKPEKITSPGGRVSIAATRDEAGHADAFWSLEFTKEKFQVDMVEQALMALPELLELARARRDPEPKAYEENVLLNRIRRKMFGVVWEVRPETAEEEAAMAARKARS